MYDLLYGFHSSAPAGNIKNLLLLEFTDVQSGSPCEVQVLQAIRTSLFLALAGL